MGGAYFLGGETELGGGPYRHMYLTSPRFSFHLPSPLFVSQAYSSLPSLKGSLSLSFQWNGIKTKPNACQVVRNNANPTKRKTTAEYTHSAPGVCLLQINGLLLAAAYNSPAAVTPPVIFLKMTSYE